MNFFQHNCMRKAQNEIIKRVIADGLAAGYQLTVFDGEEQTLKRSTDAEAIFKAMQTTDDDCLFFFWPDNKTTRSNGWVRFIYGNDGPDVINDYTTNLSDVLKGANDLAERMEDENPEGITWLT